MRRKIRLALVGLCALVVVGAFIVGIRINGDAGYPILYETEINAAADEFHIDRPLLYGLVLAESRFRADVVSPVGAVGLCQLMPGTGAGVAKRIGITAFKTSDLKIPAINARLGAAYLRSLLDAYNQDPKLALMGYNGGPGAANAYLNRGTLPRETARYWGVVLQYRDKYTEILAGREAAKASEATKAAEAAAAAARPKGIQGIGFDWIGF